MFDVGFSELIVIGLVALIVIGPQRLPTVARTVGHLLGRLQRYVSDVKSDISREMQLEELKKLQQQVVVEARDMERQVTEQMVAVESELNASIATGIEEKAESAPEPGQDALAAVSPAPTSTEAPPADKPA
jgi:sec-independent protein translocase protein TatB